MQFEIGGCQTLKRTEVYHRTKIIAVSMLISRARISITETNIQIRTNIRDLFVIRENTRDKMSQVSAKANISNYKSITATL